MTRLLTHTFWLTASRFAAQALMVMFTLLLARRLGSEGFGSYAFIAAVVLIGNALTTFGTDMHLIRGIAANGDLSALPAALAIQLGLSTLFIAAVWLAAPHLPNQSAEAIRALEVYSLALLPLAFFSIFTTALRGKNQMGAYAALNVASAILQVALIGFLLGPGGSLTTVAVLLLAAQVAVAILAGLLCAWRIPGFAAELRYGAHHVGTGLPRPYMVHIEILPLFQASAPVALLAILGILYQRLSLLMLPALGGVLLTGWFAAAARSVEAAKLFHVSAFTALYPEMSQAEPRKDFRASFRLLLAGAAGIALGLTLLAGPIVRLLFGADYLAVIPAMRVLAWALVPYTVTTFLSLGFLAAGRERLVLRGLIAGLVTLAALNLLLVPRAGLPGASWAFLAAETVQAGVLALQRAPTSLREFFVSRNSPQVSADKR
jgi:O-antigen/teichoic acid export membrane protein